MAYDDEDGDFTSPVNTDAIYTTMLAITQKNLDMSGWGAGEAQCSTTACLAGHASLAFDKAEYREVTEDGRKRYYLQTTDGRDFDVVGAELLGLNYEQAQIFYRTGIDTVEELWEGISEHTAGQATKARFDEWLAARPQMQNIRALVEAMDEEPVEVS